MVLAGALVAGRLRVVVAGALVVGGLRVVVAGALAGGRVPVVLTGGGVYTAVGAGGVVAGAVGVLGIGLEGATDGASVVVDGAVGALLLHPAASSATAAKEAARCRMFISIPLSCLGDVRCGRRDSPSRPAQ
ncbi:hypothetical protein [Rhodococcus sp. X156]|uniref:hypothetical protein n=1 Tax=Rhodococcus sp. X156 TaxID=2499145 RepID=UPI000FDB4A2F|nr:hypothetical protein [Rhodococcus sp. X156]